MSEKPEHGKDGGESAFLASGSLSHAALLALILFQAQLPRNSQDWLTTPRPTLSWLRRKYLALREWYLLIRGYLSWRNFMGLIRSAFDQRKPPPQRAIDAIRALVFDYGDYPGFSGSCFLVNAFGRSYALTARHCLGGSEPDHLRIPVSNIDGRMDLATPDAIYWYNAGDYDDTADLAVIVLPDPIPGSLDIGTCGFADPVVGETVYVAGYPKSYSGVHYDFDIDIDGQPLFAPDGSQVNHLFAWNPVVREAKCTGIPAATDLGQLEFSPDDVQEPNGMSGAPVFVERAGKLAIAGVLVRANSDRGHFIGGKYQLASTLMRVVAKNPAAVNVVERLAYAEVVGGTPATASSEGQGISAHVGMFLHAVLQGAPVGETTIVLRRWLGGEGTLGDIAVDRVLELKQRGMLQLSGDDHPELLDVLEHLRANRPTWRDSSAPQLPASKSRKRKPKKRRRRR